jgi:hypothetical protein
MRVLELEFAAQEPVELDWSERTRNGDGTNITPKTTKL